MKPKTKPPKTPPPLFIELIKVAKLVPYARNAKLHSQQQIDQVAASIQEFGFNNPVLIDKDNGIIAGHCRVLAAQKIGREYVPCIRLTHLTDVQRRAYILADNRLGETGGGWDIEMLNLEVEELKSLNFAVDVTGFDEASLQSIAAEFQGAPDDPGGGDQGEPEKANTVVVIGQYRIQIERQRYLDWLEEVRQAVGFDDPAIEKEIIRRLKL